MKKIEYELKTLNVVNKLAIVNSSIIFEKINDRIVIHLVNPASTVFCSFDAPKEHFNFEGDECSFYNFMEFYAVIHALNNPDIIHVDPHFHLIKDKKKITYRLSDRESIIENGSGNEIVCDKYDVMFKLTHEQLKEISKMINIVAGDSIKFAVKNNEIEIKISSKKTNSNTWENVYNIEKQFETGDSEFEIEVSREDFCLIPDGNYNISLNSEGLIEFDLLDVGEDVNIKLHIAEMGDTER